MKILYWESLYWDLFIWRLSSGVSDLSIEVSLLGSLYWDLSIGSLSIEVSRLGSPSWNLSNAAYWKLLCVIVQMRSLNVEEHARSAERDC